MPEVQGRLGRRAQWLAVGVLALLVLVAFSTLWRHTPVGARVDPLLTSPLVHGIPWPLRRLLSALARSWLLVGAGLLAVLLWVGALAARRIGAACTALLVPALSLLALWRVRGGWLGLGTEDFPSGHATAGFAVLASIAVLWPRAPARGHEFGTLAETARPPGAARRRWPTVLWWASVVVVAVGNITLHAHRPGEVIAAGLLVTCVASLLLCLLSPRPVRAGRLPNRGTMGPR